MQTRWLISAVLGAGAAYLIYRHFRANRVPVSGQKSSLVLYHATWCPASREFMPVWNRLKAEIAQQALPVNLNDMVCDGDSNKEPSSPDSIVVNPATCHAYGIKAYPTIILYHGDKEYIYEGDRNTIALTSFIKRHCGL
jgi:thiol-disulfide isomerase/thioredoxin